MCGCLCDLSGCLDGDELSDSSPEMVVYDLDGCLGGGLSEDDECVLSGLNDSCSDASEDDAKSDCDDLS